MIKMGISRTDYIIIGYKFPQDIKHKETGEVFDTWDDKYLPYIEGHPEAGYQMIVDGMTDKYLMFGEVLASSDESDGFSVQALKINLDEIQDLKERAQEIFGDYIEDIGEQKHYVFSHYS